jgi:NADPH-dependent 2,4-dienoyl-CoA reductase/sulfur reductase-like enzyme
VGALRQDQAREGTALKNVELVVIGGGPAGLAAAIEAREQGVKDILILEREKELGGILQQCIHGGFGLHIFGEELTGPEYAERFIEQVNNLGIQYKPDTIVLSLTPDRLVTALNTNDGLFKLKAGAVILAMGCRERTRGALNIPGTRPAGVFTAGTAQRFVNMEGYMPGRKVVILGSGDIGLIMARRLTLEGAQVKMVCELLPYSGGLTRNIVQCLQDYGIPLRLSHTIVKIHGRERVTGVTVARVGEDRKPVPGTSEYVECDTLLLSVGLIPENELSREAGIEMDPVTSGPVVNEAMETSIKGVFACGNVVHVHDLVDNVTIESRLAGKHAARRVLSGETEGAEEAVPVRAGSGIRYVVPHAIRTERVEEEVRLLFRVSDPGKNAKLLLKGDNEILLTRSCKRVTPGEMEEFRLTRADLGRLKNYSEITVQRDGT